MAHRRAKVRRKAPRVLPARPAPRIDPERAKLAEWVQRTSNGGRLNLQLVDRYCEQIRLGLPPDGVNDLLGIRPRPFWVWKQAGERYLDALEEGGTVDPADAIYGYWVARVAHALAEYRQEQTKRLHSIVIQDATWIRWMAILERRDRPTWGRYDPAGGMPEDVDPDERFL